MTNKLELVSCSKIQFKVCGLAHSPDLRTLFWKLLAFAITYDYESGLLGFVQIETEHSDLLIFENYLRNWHKKKSLTLVVYIIARIVMSKQNVYIIRGYATLLLWYLWTH
jgi:hypothetical protein